MGPYMDSDLGSGSSSDAPTPPPSTKPTTISDTSVGTCGTGLRAGWGPDNRGSNQAWVQVKAEWCVTVGW